MSVCFTAALRVFWPTELPEFGRAHRGLVVRRIKLVVGHHSLRMIGMALYPADGHRVVDVVITPQEPMERSMISGDFVLRCPSKLLKQAHIENGTIRDATLDPCDF